MAKPCETHESLLKQAEIELITKIISESCLMKNSNNKTINSLAEKLLIFIFTLIIGSAFVVYQMIADNGSESNACSFISSIHKKQQKYYSEHQGEYASTFKQLDETLEGEVVSIDGYIFKMKLNPPTGTKSAYYLITGDPQNFLWFFKRGSRHFYFDSTLPTMRSTDENRQAKADDATL